MRVVSILFYVLGGVGVILWALGYLYISGLACAFGSPNGSCRTPAPWDLGREDMLLMVVIPAAIVGTLVLIGWAFGRRAKAD